MIAEEDKSMYNPESPSTPQHVMARAGTTELVEAQPIREIGYMVRQSRECALLAAEKR